MGWPCPLGPEPIWAEGRGRAAPPLRFEVGGRTGGVDTSQLLIEMLQWAFTPVVRSRQERGMGFKVAAVLAAWVRRGC